ncbi:MAG: S1 RNA-binding domain-containing protein, partial [Bacteroidales bacterium]|nr:S1 RNA-binding domain-containing protein [Bacteroidales bacterium]
MNEEMNVNPETQEEQEVQETQEAQEVQEPQEVQDAEQVEHVEEKPTKTVVTGDATTGNVDFDWDTIGKKKVSLNAEVVKTLEDAYEKTLSQITEQEVIEGTVVSKNNREVVVNIGFKSDGIVPLAEFRYNPELKPGDKVEVYVESKEDSHGQLILSHKKARILKSWDRVNQAHETQEIITGYVKSRTKGGLIVDVF